MKQGIAIERFLAGLDVCKNEIGSVELLCRFSLRELRWARVICMLNGASLLPRQLVEVPMTSLRIPTSDMRGLSGGEHTAIASCISGSISKTGGGGSVRFALKYDRNISVYRDQS